MAEREPREQRRRERNPIRTESLLAVGASLLLLIPAVALAGSEHDEDSAFVDVPQSAQLALAAAAFVVALIGSRLRSAALVAASLALSFAWIVLFVVTVTVDF